MPTLEEQRERRDGLLADLRAILDAAAADGNRDLTEDEATRFDTLDAERLQLDADVGAAEAEERTRREQAEARAARIAEVRRVSGGPVARVGREPMTYDRGKPTVSYFIDLMRAQVRGDTEALVRLHRHARELEVELPRREERRRAIAEERMDAHFRGLGEDQRANAYEDVSPFERGGAVEARAMSTSDGSGGYSIPPLWLVDDYQAVLRNGRPYADLCMGFPLPRGTDSINIPRLATGSQVREQAESGAVTAVDMTDTYINVPVRTMAGQVDLSMQLMDWSPQSYDVIIFTDLIADYNQTLDTRCFTGTGTGMQVKGIDNVSGNTVTYTDATPTFPELYPPMMQALSKAFRTRKMPANVVLMHSTRWFWALAALDTTNRPLIVPFAQQPMNLAAVASGSFVQGPVGTIGGTPVVLDLNIPLTYGAGSNEDRIHVLRTMDHYLWESPLQARVLMEVLSGTLQVRVQVYNYVAFSAERRPESVTTISGTGLATPSGY